MLCGSASKAYAMTGWRCGWALGPADLIAAAGAIQSHATSNVSSITQKAAVEALTGSQAPVARDARRIPDAARPAVGLARRGAAPQVPQARRRVLHVRRHRRPAVASNGFRTSTDFAQALLDEARVALTPGEAFDAPGFIRISYATSLELLREGSRRLLSFVRTHAAARGATAAS